MLYPRVFCLHYNDFIKIGAKTQVRFFRDYENEQFNKKDIKTIPESNISCSIERNCFSLSYQTK